MGIYLLIFKRKIARNLKYKSRHIKEIVIKIYSILWKLTIAINKIYSKKLEIESKTKTLKKQHEKLS